MKKKIDEGLKDCLFNGKGFFNVRVKKIPENEGGGYMAYYPFYGWALVGDGETEQDAIANLERCRWERIKSELTGGGK